jgi:DNA-directed RNA polymerase subunit beta
VKDSSLKVPPGMEGVVIDVKIFSRIEDQVVEKDRGERIGEVRRLEGEEKLRVNDVRDASSVSSLDGSVSRWRSRAARWRRRSRRERRSRPTCWPAQDRVARPQDVPRRDKKVNEQIRTIIDAANDEKARIEEKAEERIDRILQPDELPPGVIQLVKVYLAEKRKISVGDKMAAATATRASSPASCRGGHAVPAGRQAGGHRAQPLGVPSRMNVGQILETHLGWAAKLLGFYAKTPVFQGANEKEIGLLLKIAGLTWVKDALELRTAQARDHRRRRERGSSPTSSRSGSRGEVHLLTDVR